MKGNVFVIKDCDHCQTNECCAKASASKMVLFLKVPSYYACQPYAREVCVKLCINSSTGRQKLFIHRRYGITWLVHSPNPLQANNEAIPYRAELPY